MKAETCHCKQLVHFPIKFFKEKSHVCDERR